MCKGLGIQTFKGQSFSSFCPAGPGPGPGAARAVSVSATVTVTITVTVTDFQVCAFDGKNVVFMKNTIYFMSEYKNVRVLCTRFYIVPPRYGKLKGPDPVDLYFALIMIQTKPTAVSGMQGKDCDSRAARPCIISESSRQSNTIEDFFQVSSWGLGLRSHGQAFCFLSLRLTPSQSQTLKSL